MNNWKDKIEQYCIKYNIPTTYIAETMYEPKVIPMIRGKAFEFSVMLVLQEILDKDKWEISKPTMNAQLGFHDIDVRALYRPTNKVVRIECKLSKKEGYRLFADGHSEIRVKCMRSRTLGKAKVKELAPKLGISEKTLSIHNDQYLPADFDVVITSIGNAFYGTNEKTGLFEWEPTDDGKVFLQKLCGSAGVGLKDFAFNQLFMAYTQDLAIGHSSGVVCTRGKCSNKKNCGFVPNYPVINFNSATNRPTNGWIPIEEAGLFFGRFVK